MKRVILILIFSVVFVSSMLALPFSEARREAWFLTDKMAYELNLSHEQYDYVYQVNLEYFLNVNSAKDCYGKYWNYRDADLFYILQDWQYTLYKATSYFLSPIQWIHNGWHFNIYNHYRKGYHFFFKPHCYTTYKGGKWKHRKEKMPSVYKNHKYHPSTGLRDNYHKGNSIDGKHPSVYQRSQKLDEKKRPSVNRQQTKPQSSNAPVVNRPNNRSSQTANPPRGGNTKTPTRQQPSRGNNKREFGR